MFIHYIIYICIYVSVLKGWCSILKKETKGQPAVATWCFFPKRQAHAASSQKPTKAAQEAVKPMEVCEVTQVQNAP